MSGADGDNQPACEILKAAASGRSDLLSSHTGKRLRQAASLDGVRDLPEMELWTIVLKEGGADTAK
jgi:hypothetical protein